MSTSTSFVRRVSTFEEDTISKESSFKYAEPNSGTENITDEDIRIEASNVSVVKEIPNYQESLNETIKQIWTGHVTAIDNETFTVRVEDLTNKDNPEEIVVLSLEELGRNEKSRLSLGAIIMWHMGYRDGHGYPRESFSKITLRRFPNWTQVDLEDAEKLAEEYANLFASNPA